MLRRQVVALVLGVIVLASGCAEDDPDEAPSVIFDLEVGDCFDDPSGGSTEVGRDEAISCDAPHDAEVYALVEASGGADFPGDELVLEMAGDGCAMALDDLVEGSDAAPSLQAAPIRVPTAHSWKGGDRRIICAAYARSGDPLAQPL